MENEKQNEEKQAYEIEMEIFMRNYKKSTTDGEDVGYVIAKLSQYFASSNLMLSNSETNYSMTLAKISEEVDEKNKPISAAKAKVMADATDEARIHGVDKMHLENIQQYINSLKAMQKGILCEYSHMGGT